MENDLSNILKNSNLSDKLNNLNPLSESFYNELQMTSDMNSRKGQVEQATIDAEKHLDNLNNTVATLQKQLETERTNREKADEENKKANEETKKAAKKESNRNLIIAIVGLIISIISLFK